MRGEYGRTGLRYRQIGGPSTHTGSWPRAARLHLDFRPERGQDALHYHSLAGKRGTLAILTFLRPRAWGALVACVLWAVAAAAGCGSSGPGTTFNPQGSDASAAGNDATAPGTDASGQDDASDDAPSFGSGDAGAATLSITPGTPTASVTITNGVVATTPVTLQAMATNANGSVPVAAVWSFDRGELGSIGSSSGVFTASGNLGGVGNVTATWNGLTAKVELTVTLTDIQNGGPSTGDAGVAEAGAGGIGGVGGSGPGGSVDSGTQSILTGSATPPSSPSELGWLYPYDQTVWPRGILAPLLQWSTTHTVSAVYIHLTQKNYEFKGFYSGTALVNQPIDATAWQQAAYGNGGDELQVQIVVTDGTTAWGPITEHWIIAPGVLQGTVLLRLLQLPARRYRERRGPRHPARGDGAEHRHPGDGQHVQRLPRGVGRRFDAIHAERHDGERLRQRDVVRPDEQGRRPSDLHGHGERRNDQLREVRVVGSLSRRDVRARKRRRKHRHARGLRRTFEPLQALRRDAPSPPRASRQPSRPQRRRRSRPTAREVAFNYWSGTATNGVSPGNGHNLAVMDFDCGQTRRRDGVRRAAVHVLEPAPALQRSQALPGLAGVPPGHVGPRLPQHDHSRQLRSLRSRRRGTAPRPRSGGRT